MKVAIPTMGQGGMDCERSGHFGHCDCFTVVDIQDGEIAGTSIIDNPPHEEGGCLRPVSLLADNGIDAIVGFQQVGITVYFENQTPNVGEVAKMAAAGTLPVMGAEHACHH